jgi:GNAT superfamily N-acetyltransferase
MAHNVRRANIGDLEKLIEFTMAEAAEAEGISKNTDKVREGILTALNDETIASYWVLENAGEVIGNASIVKEWSDWNAGYYWWIQSMYLAPQYRGQGLMLLLLHTIKDSARENQALELRLYVHKDNARAINAYLKSSFKDSDYRVMIADIGV